MQWNLNRQVTGRHNFRGRKNITLYYLYSPLYCLSLKQHHPAVVELARAHSEDQIAVITTGVEEEKHPKVRSCVAVSSSNYCTLTTKPPTISLLDWQGSALLDSERGGAEPEKATPTRSASTLLACVGEGDEEKKGELSAMQVNQCNRRVLLIISLKPPPS